MSHRDCYGHRPRRYRRSFPLFDGSLPLSGLPRDMSANTSSTWSTIASNDRWPACFSARRPGKRQIGTDSSVGIHPTRQSNLKMMTNNTRYLILPWVKVVNLASFILGACLRRLRTDWYSRYGHDLCLVETFVDRSRFVGTCYQAANWVRIGRTKGRSRQDRYKRIKVPVKDLYVYPLTADFKQRLCAGN